MAAVELVAGPIVQTILVLLEMLLDAMFDDM